MPLFTHLFTSGWRGNTARRPYDVIVRCLGWKQDTSMYTASVNPTPAEGKKATKYAALSPEFESINTRGLFFAGALGHGLDWRKSSGGFIHGFRYTARALTRVLETRLYSVPWPHKSFDIPTDGVASMGDLEPTIALLARAFTDRIAEAAGPYQMFGMLADGMLFCRDGETDQLRAVYMEEVPSAMFDARWALYPRLLWAFRYARPSTSLADVAELGTSFGPFVWAWHCGSDARGDAACAETRDHQRKLNAVYESSRAQGAPRVARSLLSPLPPTPP